MTAQISALAIFIFFMPFDVFVLIMVFFFLVSGLHDKTLQCLQNIVFRNVTTSSAIFDTDAFAQISFIKLWHNF